MSQFRVKQQLSFLIIVFVASCKSTSPITDLKNNGVEVDAAKSATAKVGPASGVLIDEHTLLTAAHVVVDDENCKFLESIDVKVGNNSYTARVTVYPDAIRIGRSQGRCFTLFNKEKPDLAILKIPQKVPVQPVPLATKPCSANKNIVTVSGYGIGSPDIDLDGVLNRYDYCLNTPKGSKVSENGCTEQQMTSPPGKYATLPAEEDHDQDGVPNKLDQCMNTPKNLKPQTTGPRAGCYGEQKTFAEYDQIFDTTTLREGTVKNYTCGNGIITVQGSGSVNSTPNFTSPAPGDSGGPLYRDGEVIGIVHGANRNEGSKKYFADYTDLTEEAVQTWIENQR